MANENLLTISAIGVREEILQFAVAMEEEMRKKDSKYNENDRSNVIFLIDHLREERVEVDVEIDNLKLYHDKSSISDCKIDLKTELVHEAIMAMLVYNVIKV